MGDLFWLTDEQMARLLFALEPWLGECVDDALQAKRDNALPPARKIRSKTVKCDKRRYPTGPCSAA
ncbi:MAG: hypothetical protein BGO58_10370 [Sphingopyxis sp. 65-8]|nr:MAG: hypothetical protein BGO58_10370 [Sphingopyxis sp. 65-8]